VLRPGGAAPAQQIVLHWPGLAFAQRELTPEWCAAQWGRVVAPAFGAVRPRNTLPYVPMYGCTLSDDPTSALTVAWLVDGQGGLQADWAAWLRGRPHLDRVLHVGGTARWPAQRAITADRLARLLPLICSINPMGTPCRRLLPARDADVAAAEGDAARPEEAKLRRVLEHLGPARRATHRSASHVGELMHVVARGAAWALNAWIQWYAGADPGPQAESELLQEWEDFQYADPNTDAWSELYEMVRCDETPGGYAAFLTEQRAGEHTSRRAPEGSCWEVMGSGTHHDLALYVLHELRSVAVCTDNRSGCGMWYVYRRDSHRWCQDPDGTTVLVWCVAIMRAQLDRLRERYGAGAAAPGGEGSDSGAGGAGGRSRSRLPFTYVANFPESDENAERAMLMHLDTVMGDIRHVQSIVKYMGRMLTQREFAEQLDVAHEHLIPFANGVLDLNRLCLRPGMPSDLVRVGPAYHWADFRSSDVVSADLEKMLTQIFTDRVVLSYFLEVGGTWLRRRNRFKHLYVMTGGRARPTRHRRVGRARWQHQRGQESPVQSGEGGLRGAVRAAADPSHHRTGRGRLQPQRLSGADARAGDLHLQRAGQQLADAHAGQGEGARGPAARTRVRAAGPRQR
jgi:hypothetical protein